jgi:hypothetical protein
MSEKNNGGAAYPNVEYMAEEGMSLRDYFAGQELAKTIGPVMCDEATFYDRLADHCYRMADAMLRARAE